MLIEKISFFFRLSHTTIFLAEIYDRQNCVMHAPITFLSFNLKTIKLI